MVANRGQAVVSEVVQTMSEISESSNTQMPRDGGKRNVEGLGKLSHRGSAERQPRKNAAPGGIEKG